MFFFYFLFFNFLAIKKIKGNEFKTPKEYKDEYIPIATPLNTEEVFKINCLQKVPEPEYCVSPEHHLFVLPKTPSPIPLLSPIPESPEIQQTNEQEIQTQEQNEIQIFLAQTEKSEQSLQQPYLTNEVEQPLYEQLVEQPLQQNMYEQLVEQPLQQNMYEQLVEQTETYEHQQHCLTTETNETNDVVMEVITETLKNPIQSSRSGKNITMLKRQFNCLQEEEEEEEEEQEEEREELRTTTKNNKRFHKHLILKKKDEVVKKFPILSQKNTDLIVTAENKFKELKSIFILKKIYIGKNRELKDHIYGLELIEHRYRCETERMIKKKKK